MPTYLHEIYVIPDFIKHLVSRGPNTHLLTETVVDLMTFLGLPLIDFTL